ncbi:aminoglycoside phosphotransferase family protein [Micromonospora auratinigra]|uniref:aminoglycoside phosphotransferase family protein n=1 Tax=Micromonospora auratinigra TaxID=261654 RepID=UPI000B86EA1F|nr:aminoglycoside phosphotransferase family protein [Micromonospora auratinigra]
MVQQRIIVVDDRVYRPAGWWTPTVHALLEYLHGVGFTCVPKPFGVVDGTEVLGFIQGESGAVGWQRAVPEAGLRSLARLLRDYHQAVAGFVAPDGACWALSDRPAQSGEVICHGDFGPWNVIWDGLRPVGLVDFDFAQPGDALDDAAYALEYLAPFRDDAHAMRWQGFTAPPDRVRRIELFAEEYGMATGEGLVEAVIRRQQLTGRNVRALAERGLEPQRSWVADGFCDELASRVQWSKDNRALFTSRTCVRSQGDSPSPA